METEVLVVGAGAAGLWAAEAAARGGRKVCLVEKTPRTGTKVLASGGTHCNLTTTLAPEAAAETFGPSGARFLRGAFRALTPTDVRERFAEWGVATVEAPLDKIFPASGRARDVRDALERAVAAAGVTVRRNAPVVGLERERSGWSALLESGERIRCRALFLCPGGKSYPRTGTTGDGYPWLEAVGLQVIEPVPALVPLRSHEAWVQGLTGIAVQDVEARLSIEGAAKVLGRRRRPVLFTHQGLSGPAAMDLSVHVARAPRGTRHTLRLDLCPDLSREALRELLVQAAGAPGAPRLGRVLPVELPRRLLREVCAQAGLGGPGDPGAGEPRANALSRETRHALVETLKGLAVAIDGTLDFDQAEVTAGGLALHHVDPRTMEVRGHPGLFAFGELLDLAGPIGGLNFQAAFATAELAARAISG